jgi:hypothetical protein
MGHSPLVNSRRRPFQAYGIEVLPIRRFEDSQRTIPSLKSAPSPTPQENAELRKTFETAGPVAFFRKEAEVEQQWMERGKYRSALLIALHYIAAGDNDKTLTWLERAVEEHAGWLPDLKMEPTWDPLRSNPRFVALVKKVGLEK